jgi:prevent-host-death family protein
MQGIRIGIREFRENLAGYLLSSKPVTITRHGEPIGYVVPVRRRPTKTQLETLHEAGEKIDAMLAEAGVTEDELVRDFRKLRRERRKAKA